MTHVGEHVTGLIMVIIMLSNESPKPSSVEGKAGEVSDNEFSSDRQALKYAHKNAQNLHWDPPWNPRGTPRGSQLKFWAYLTCILEY